MTALYDQIAEMARLGMPGVVATVIRTEGSVPRKAGAKMIIDQDGKVIKTFRKEVNKQDILAIVQPLFNAHASTMASTIK